MTANASPSLRFGGWLVVALLFGASLWVHREVLDQGILGFDSFTAIDTSRIESFADFTGTFTESLIDDRITVRFFRPVQNLSLAFDYWRSGLNPRGYQWHSLILFAATVGALFIAAQRLLGKGWVGPLVGALLFALHPSVQSVLPVPCRRSELLVTLFLLLTLAVLPRPGERARARCWVAGALVLLASGSKDYGAMGVGLVFLHQWLHAAPGQPRVVRATRASLPALLGATVYLINRTLVLKGVGGYLTESDPEVSPLERFGNHAASLMRDLFDPWPHRGPDGLAWLTGGTLLLLAGLATFLRRPNIEHTDTPNNPPPERTPSGIPVALAVAWLLPPLALLLIMDEYASWYSVFPLAGVALLVSGLMEEGVRAWQERRRPVGSVIGLIVLGIVALPLRGSPLFHPDPDWPRASKHLSNTLTSLDEQMQSAKLGDVIVVKSFPYSRSPKDRPRPPWIATVMDEGIQAYVSMKYSEFEPTTTFTVPEPPPPDRVTVVVRYAGSR